jgi:hypothetical protein
MSLISFHRLLISAGIAFCVFFAGWEVRESTRAGGTASVMIAVVFGVLAIGLSVYLHRLNRILGIEGDGG